MTPESSVQRSETTTTASTSTASTSAAASTHYDLARLIELKDAFPPGFVPDGQSTLGKLAPEYAHLVGDTVSDGRPFTVVPPQCRPLLKPADGLAGADKIGIGAAEGPDKRALVVSVDSPVTVPAAPPSTGCERMTFDIEDDAVLTNGTAERLAAPDIDGAVTSAVKITINEYQYVEYFYIAILDTSTYVQVWARQYPDFQPEPLLPDLLNKAVTAIRG